MNTENTPPPSPFAMEATPNMRDLIRKYDNALFASAADEYREGASYATVKRRYDAALTAENNLCNAITSLENQLTACKAALEKEREALDLAEEKIPLMNLNLAQQLETSRANEQKLAAEVDDLKSWRESASQVFNDLNLQAIGKELGLRLGSNIAKEILPRITRERTVRRELARITQWMRDRYEHGIKLLTHNQTPGAGELIADAKETLQQVDAVLAASRALDNDNPHVA